MPQATPTKARPAAPGKCAPGKPQALKGVGPGLLVNLGPFSCPYSTKCVEGEFSEVPPPEVAALYTKIGLLADAPNTECLLPWRIVRTASFSHPPRRSFSYVCKVVLVFVGTQPLIPLRRIVPSSPDLVCPYRQVGLCTVAKRSLRRGLMHRS